MEKNNYHITKPIDLRDFKLVIGRCQREENRKKTSEQILRKRIHYFIMEETETTHRALRILELYSGIGGMHVAAKETGLPFEIVGSYEINTTALDVYRHNFPQTPKAYNIMGLTLEQLTAFAPDIIMMSPPCQPFTRQGLKRDVADARTSSLLHLLGLLEEVHNPPSKILLENVVGFEKSLARERLLEMLSKRNYTWQEFLLSPTQFGIPNSRLRYYLLAKLQPASFCFTVSNELKEAVPFCLCAVNSSLTSCNCSKTRLNSLYNMLYKYHSSKNVATLETGDLYSDFPLPLSSYLNNDTNYEQLLLKDKILDKYCMILDIVDRNFTRCCCFTKGYGHYVEGTGSVIRQDMNVDISSVYNKVNNLPVGDPKRLDLLKKLKLRYFTPDEIAKLMCFPSWFTLPQSLTVRQKYRVLGNSINILVVTSLLLILCEE
ncbi:tRNA (cytosine-5-)-methyltransferase [Halocaridina rubra]|uniref:tRNA (cytosine(38)-C(5))-methyltransferase n=1 Tax=Halocaridina rubra TaxID=373956 RepID=A0AAN8XM11_HALRR